jgi:ribosomal protein S18 acetylase RimI-like enzyme
MITEMAAGNMGDREGRPSFVDGVTLRTARAEDHAFALALYLESTKPLLIALSRWNEEQILSRFAQGFKLEQIQVLRSAGADIGWMQVSESPEELHLDQLHLVDGARSRGIGTGLIQQLKSQASTSNRAVALNVIRGNRAQQLYERLGFNVAGGDEERVRMFWRQEQSASAETKGDDRVR